MAPLLEVRGVSKSFPGVHALRDVDFRLDAGEVVALVGENGAGKSTLMRVLAGIHPPDRGSLYWRGTEVKLRDPRAASTLGIALIHQELNLADNLDLAGNVLLGREPHRGGWLRVRELQRLAGESLCQVGLTLSPQTPLQRLSLGQRQLVEIAKALSLHAKVLILDEPTSSLSRGEADRLFLVMDELRRQGVAMIYISHRLDEVQRVASRVVVLRDGRIVDSLSHQEIDRQRMLTMMVGRPIVPRSLSPDRAQAEPLRPILRLDRVRTNAFPSIPVSLTVAPGEIVGLAGLIGAGRTELLETIFGMRRPVGGQVLLRDKDLAAVSLQGRIAAGIGLVPEDRKQHGLILGSSVRHNLSLRMLSRLATAGWVHRRQEQDLAAAQVQSLGVRCRNDMQMSVELSGGNQQKLVLGRWLAGSPSVLLLDEPTRGIDVGAKQELHLLLEQLAAKGMAILFASSDMEELLRLATRVLVMREGMIAGELQNGGLTEQAMIQLATRPQEAA